MIGAGFDLNDPMEALAWNRVEVLKFFLNHAPIATYEDVLRDRLSVEGGKERNGEERATIEDGTRLAVRDLAGKGILHQEGQTIYATRAAREVARLLNDEIPPDGEI